MLGAVALVIFPTSSCDDLFNCIDGNGVLKIEDRLVAEFYGVENRTSFNVEIYNDSQYMVRVTADENLLDEIQTTVRSGNLIVDVEGDRCLNSDKNITVELHMPSIDYVDLSGSGDIDVVDFVCSRLEIYNSGSGDIDLTDIVSLSDAEIHLSGSGDVNIWGKAESADYTLSGSGDLYAKDFKLDNCKAENSGSGDIYCYASEYLNAILTGSGDIFYSGNPPVVNQVNKGSGTISKRN